MRFRAWVFFILFSLAHAAWAQTEDGWGPERSVWAGPGTDALFLDSLPVIENSLAFRNTAGQLTYPLFNFYNHPYPRILFIEPLCDSLEVTFTVIPLPLHQRFYRKDTSLFIPNLDVNPDLLYEAQADDRGFQPFAGLNSTGSISRGVSVGNNQDAVLNSSLNLQLSGDLGAGTQIRASITDNSIPVQADGYTQQLREFDRVYIELENKDFGILRAGDYNMVNPDNYFLRFDKRISGAGIFTGLHKGENHYPIQLQGGIARGKFARNRFMGQEGNQGPYKLTGNNGEQFIIIISGSERVYIDGVLMKRGQQYDYVIDYNAGEITFTALQPITKERRVVVEFQYTEQNYLRSVGFASGGFESKNFRTAVQFYTEQDSKNQPLSQDLTDDQKRLLSNVGDHLEQARVTTIAPTSFNDAQVQYELVDSLGYDSVLVYSADSTKQLYQASFTYLGPNQGNYILSQNNANGRVFRWVAPVNGIPQGSYEPIRQLIAPNQLQILSINSLGNFGNGHSLSVDLAGSKNDINLFSDLDEGNDQGVAGKIAYGWVRKLERATLNTTVHYEFNDHNFTTIERIRNVEFARDWNLPLNYNSGIQLGGVAIGIQNDSTRTGLRSDFLNFSGYQGFRNTLTAGLQKKEDRGTLSVSWLTTRDSAGTTNFFREKGFFTHYLLPRFWVGIRSVGEWNRQLAKNSDTLRSASYNFLEYQLYSGFGDTTRNFTELSYMQRYDDTARFGRFRQFSKAISYGLKSQYQTTFNSTLQLQANIRNLKVYQPEEKNLQRTITSRINYTQRLFANAITSTTFYECGSGTEPRRSFSYLEVPAGTGTYTHTDYNGNGIKELDEFEVAPTPDLARYVRIYTVSTDYLRTSLLKFGENLNISSPANWRGRDDFRRILSRFSLLFNYQLDRKTLLQNNVNQLNPFEKVTDDSLVVSLNNNFRSTVFFNRAATKFGADYTYRRTDNRNLLSFGVEQRNITENTVNLRFQVVENLIFKTKGSLVRKQNISANFSRRNFVINQVENNYSLAYQSGGALVIAGRYEIDSQNAEADENSALFGQTIGLDLTYNLAEKINTLLSLNYIRNDFEGTSNSPAGFEMLQGLQPGNNGTWNLTLQRTLKKNILISLNYSGRVSPAITPVHTGNLEIKAFF